MPGTFGRVVEVDIETGIRHVLVLPHCRCMHAPETRVKFPVRWSDLEYDLIADPAGLIAEHACEHPTDD